MPDADVVPAGGGERRSHLPVVLGLEGVDLEVAPDDDRERRRLHAAERERAAARPDPRRRGAARVHADEPVCLRTGAGGVFEGLHLLVVLEVCEGVADRLLRHRREPGAADRLRDAGGLVDQLEDQLTLAPGVARVHDLGDVLALHQAVQRGQRLLRAGVARLVPERRRKDRQILESPRLELRVVGLGVDLLDEVTDGERDDVGVRLVVLTGLLRAECLRDIGGDARLLADDETLTHVY
jgi:hypothetical protein